MATAGCGDVLSGIIGGLIVQGMSVEDAAALGVYLHGKSGDIMKSCYSNRGLMASDILDGLRVVFCECEN